MRTVVLTAAVFGALLAPLAATPATALPLHLGGLAIQADDDSIVQQVRRVVAGRHGVAVVRPGVRPGVAVVRPGVVRPGVAVAAGVAGTAWRVGWVGSGYYYNPAYYDRYYHPSYGYCRIVSYQGQRVCRWYRQRWW